MTDMKTPPATPMTRKLVKRMGEVEKNLKEVLKGAASEYVIEIKIRKIPESKSFSPINEVTPVENAQEKVYNEARFDKSSLSPNKEVTSQHSDVVSSKSQQADITSKPPKVDVASELPKVDVASELLQANVSSKKQHVDITSESPIENISADSQQEDISPESSLALALIEKEMIPSNRKLRRNGNNRRSIKIKKFRPVSSDYTGSVESENKVLQEYKPSDPIPEQSEIIPNPSNPITEDPETVSASQAIVSNSIRDVSSRINITSETVGIASEPVKVISVPNDDLSEQGEALNPPKVAYESEEKIMEQQEVVSKPVENESEWGELVSECDDITSDAEDVTFSEDLTPDLFRSNIRSELAELAMELIGSEPALADLALRLGTHEASPELQSDLVSTPDLPDLAEIKPIKTEIEKIEVIVELSPENESSELFLSKVNKAEKEHGLEEGQVVSEEEKESSELLLSEVNIEEREYQSEERQVILQEVIDKSAVESVEEGSDIVTLHEESPVSVKEDSYEEKEKCIMVAESFSETENLPGQVSVEKIVEIKKAEKTFEQVKQLSDDLSEEIRSEFSDIKEERKVFPQKKEPYSHAPAPIKKQHNLKAIEIRYIGYIAVIFLILFYFLDLLEKSQAPPVHQL